MLHVFSRQDTIAHVVSNIIPDAYLCEKVSVNKFMQHLSGLATDFPDQDC